MAYMERLGMVRSPALTLLLRLHGSQWNPTQKTSAEEPPRRHRPVRERGHLRPPSEGGCAVFVSSEGGIGDDVGDGVRFKQPLRERHHILILSMNPRIMAVDFSMIVIIICNSCGAACLKLSVSTIAPSSKGLLFRTILKIHMSLSPNRKLLSLVEPHLPLPEGFFQIGIPPKLISCDFR